MRWLSRVVTVLTIVLVLLGVALLIRAKMPKRTVGTKFHTCAMFRDGTRLATGSPVMIAGVRIGEISNLTIENGFARIDMDLVDKVDVPVDSWVTKRAYSPFGDSYIEIIPSGGEEGASSGVKLRSGQCFTRVIEGSSTDTVLRTIARNMDPFQHGLERVHEVALDGRKWAKANIEDRALDVDKWIDEGHIDKPLDSANATLTGWADRSTRAAQAVSDAKPSVDKGLDRAQKFAAAAKHDIAEYTVRVKTALQNAREGMNAIDKPVDDFAEVLAAVNEGRGNDGKGQFGRFVNNPKLGNDIEEISGDIAEGTSNFSRFKSWLGLRIEWNIFTGAPRFFLTAEVRPRPDKFYLVELEKGPLGAYASDELHDAAGTLDWTRRQEIKDQIRFTAQFGKTFWNWFQVRGGIKESTFGFGADILMREGKLKFSTDLYGSFTRVPRLKLAAAIYVFRSIFLVAGVDDALNKPGYLSITTGNTAVPNQFETLRYGRDYFLGATLQFDDADLATLLRVYGAVLVGLL